MVIFELLLAALVLRVMDMLAAAIWPAPDWQQSVRAWRRSPQWAEAEADIARARAARTASPPVAPAPPPSVPRRAQSPAPPPQ